MDIIQHARIKLETSDAKDSWVSNFVCPIFKSIENKENRGNEY